LRIGDKFNVMSRRRDFLQRKYESGIGRKGVGNFLYIFVVDVQMKLNAKSGHYKPHMPPIFQ